MELGGGCVGLGLGVGVGVGLGLGLGQTLNPNHNPKPNPSHLGSACSASKVWAALVAPCETRLLMTALGAPWLGLGLGSGLGLGLRLLE